MKDGVFTAFFALFFVLYIELCLKYIKQKQQDFVLKRCFALGIAELAVALTRNNGIYMVLASDVVLLIFIIRKRRLLEAAFVKEKTPEEVNGPVHVNEELPVYLL